MPSDIDRSQAQRLIQYATNRLGSQEGNGECWTLVNNAFEHLDFHNPEGLYVWGRALESGTNARPGDVFQFRNFKVKVERPDGSWEEQTRGAPRHTAILESIENNGYATFLECNIGGNKNVQRNRFYIRTADLEGGTTVRASGSITIYRPQMP
jgi:hypothetical protein